MANESTLSAPTQAIRRLAGRRAATAPPVAVSFPELVWAHFIRQREVHETGSLNGEADEEYRRRLAAFEASEGRLVNAYWCVCEASAVALTAKPRRTGFARVFRQPDEIRFHSATDWVTRDSPEIANVLHTCETLAVRASEILRGPTERIAMQWILATAGHMLGFADESEGKRTRSETARLVRRKRNELEKIEAYYHRAGEKVGRLVYFTGMLLGVALVAATALAAGILGQFFTEVSISWTKRPRTCGVLLDGRRRRPDERDDQDVLEQGRRFHRRLRGRPRAASQPRRVPAIHRSDLCARHLLRA